jgi:hypothetical protein
MYMNSLPNLVPFDHQHGWFEIDVIPAQNGNVTNSFSGMDLLLRFPADREIQPFVIPRIIEVVN